MFLPKDLKKMRRQQQQQRWWLQSEVRANLPLLATGEEAN